MLFIHRLTGNNQIMKGSKSKQNAKSIYSKRLLICIIYLLFDLYKNTKSYKYIKREIPVHPHFRVVHHHFK